MSKLIDSKKFEQLYVNSSEENVSPVVRKPHLNCYSMKVTRHNSLNTKVQKSVYVDQAINNNTEIKNHFLERPDNNTILIPQNFSNDGKGYLIAQLENNDDNKNIELSSNYIKNDKDRVIIRKLDIIIEHNYANSKFTVRQAIKLLGIGERGLQRKMKKHLQITPSHYLRNYRLNQSKYLLEKGIRISRVALNVGFA